HNAVHALHDAHVIQHSEPSHHYEPEIDHFHESEHDSGLDHDNFNHHSPIDFATYYEEFLHIDLKNSDQTVLISELIPTYNLDYDFDVSMFSNNPIKITSFQKRGPPNGLVFKPNFSSIYLTTLRIRV
ncbi:MAG: hypothetical protein GTO02_11345, partial [Candidatus Dadabacteria bacterium]|nr:hypothetical protein [Candidatus Dadabacteria bacterium]NIQ14954.1 hypothetical protein [Candidatus Dadabacteria bacterium]